MAIKIAYMFGSMNRGGAETLLLDIFHRADNAPFEMICIHRKGGAYKEDFYAAGPSMYQLTPSRFGHVKYLLRLRRLLQNENVTVIHTQHWLDCIYAWMATVGINIPIVITFHGYVGANANWLKGMRYRMAMCMAKKLCFVSAEQMRQYENRYGAIVRKKGVVLYNGIDFTKFDSIKPREDLTLEIGNLTFEKDRVKLCMVGNFNSVRSQMVVCEALQKLRVKSEELKDKFDVCFIGGRYKGEEHYYDECVAYCKEQGLDNVHFLGTREDVPAWLKSMDGFVYSSRNDTFGIAVIEAIASGLPVVVNDHPVMREVCGDTNDGIRYFSTDDAEDAAAQIEDMITNLEQSKKQAKENAVKVRVKYSIESHINNVYRIYSSL